MIKNEWKSLWNNKILIIVVMAIIIIPVIYAGLFLKSMWDPYGNLDQLPVAVVNNDKSVEYDGKTLSVGSDMVDELKDNDALDFHFVDSEEAEQGLKNGTYYVVITTGLYCAFFIIWHSYSLTIVSAWQILGTIYLGMLFIQVALMLYLGMYWNDFINSIAGSFSTDIVYSIGLLFTTLFCHIKTYILKWVILFNGLCIYIFVGGFYIDPYVFNKLQYGTFTGETKEKAVLILPETDKEKGSETNIPQGYQV